MWGEPCVARRRPVAPSAAQKGEKLVPARRCYRLSANIAVVAASLLIFVVSLFLARSQVTVGDVEWMRAMIPHHSIAILTSERAKITDPRVRKLADGIISAQKREIGEMQALIAELAKR